MAIPGIGFDLQKGDNKGGFSTILAFIRWKVGEDTQARKAEVAQRWKLLELFLREKESGLDGHGIGAEGGGSVQDDEENTPPQPTNCM